MKRRTSTGPTLPHSPTTTLPDGRTLTQGDEFSIPHEGRYAFAYEFQPDGSITAFGPVNSKTAMWRSFKPESVKTIHRNKNHHASRKDAS